MSYFAPIASVSINTFRSAGVIGPTREAGGLMSVRCTGAGAPSGSSSETSASPTFSSVIALSTSTPGLARNVVAAAFTAA